MAAHKVAWEIANGPIPEGNGYHGKCVLHRCDNPACVNPGHLFLGSHDDNMADMLAKGRARKGGGSPATGLPFVKSYCDRSGKVRHYFRRKGMIAPLPVDQTSAAFRIEYDRLLAMRTN